MPWLSLLGVRSSVSTEEPAKTIYSCPEVQCSAPAASVLPARDGPKDAKGEQVQSHDHVAILRRIERPIEFPWKNETFRNKRNFRTTRREWNKVTDDLQRQVTALETEAQILEAELNRHKKERTVLHSNGICTNHKLVCRNLPRIFLHQSLCKNCTLTSFKSAEMYQSKVAFFQLCVHCPGKICGKWNSVITQKEIMLSYSSYTLIALAALLVTCHALSKCPEISGLPGIPGRNGLKGLPDSLARKFALANLKHRLFQLEAALALNGKIRKVGEKILASNGKKADFVSALQSCEEVGGTLAAPKNEEENKAIMDIVKQYNRYAYLGIRKGETSGQVKYLNGMPLSYSNWHQHEPNGKGTEKCVEMYTDGTWNDKTCNMYRLTICEF
ncbi:uncharacterized protein LOC128937174 [Melozone crissalis]|uniref:uncharacterized protein LOC128937174 n=1 Tax=Melozone crissalis TaxID=40204 RepID=UPI0023DC6315|nr:uncharacterized protein LOC128937174 [Melozone crissalis]